MYSCLYNICADTNLFHCVLQGWVFAHFRNLLPRICNEDYDPVIAPLVSQWKPTIGFTVPGHYRDDIDSLEHSHVIWRLYERRRHITPFHDIYWYSIWIMAGKDRRVRHFPERVLRQYGYVQRTWHRLSWSFLCMSSACSRGVIWFRIASRGLILGVHEMVH